MHSALCDCILTVIAFTLCNICQRGICALLLIISNVVQNINLIVALDSAHSGSILAVILLTVVCSTVHIVTHLCIVAFHKQCCAKCQS